MLVTLFGMVKLVRLVQESNAWDPTLATLAPRMMLVRLEQAENAWAKMAVTPAGTVYIPTLVSGHRMSVVWLLLNKTPSKLL